MDPVGVGVAEERPAALRGERERGWVDRQLDVWRGVEQDLAAGIDELLVAAHLVRMGGEVAEWVAQRCDGGSAVRVCTRVPFFRGRGCGRGEQQPKRRARLVGGQLASR